MSKRRHLSFLQFSSQFPLLQLFTGADKSPCLFSLHLFPCRPISTGRTLADNSSENSIANATTIRGRRGPLHPPPRLPQLWNTSWCRRVSAPPFLHPFLRFSSETSQKTTPIRQSSLRFRRKGDTIFLAAGLEQSARLRSRGSHIRFVV